MHVCTIAHIVQYTVHEINCNSQNPKPQGKHLNPLACTVVGRHTVIGANNYDIIEACTTGHTPWWTKISYLFQYENHNLNHQLKWWLDHSRLWCQGFSRGWILMVNQRRLFNWASVKCLVVPTPNVGRGTRCTSFAAEHVPISTLNFQCKVATCIML